MLRNYRSLGSAMWVVLLVLAGACTATTGAHGTLGFGYRGSDGLMPTRLTAALAAGEEIDVVVYIAKRPNESSNYATIMGKRELMTDRVKQVAVRTAHSSDPKVLVVSQFDGSSIRLRGIAAGTAELDVATDAGRDTISIRVARVGHVEIDHWAWRDSQQTSPTETVLLRGGLVHFLLKRKTNDGQDLTGYGASASVSVDPSTSVVENDPEDTSHFRVRPRQLGQLLLAPKQGTGLSMQVVEPADVIQLEVRPLQRATNNHPTVPVGSGRWYTIIAVVTDGRRALGLDGPLQLEVQDSSVCQPEQLSPWLGDGLVAIRGLSPGECRISARLGEGTTAIALTVVEDSAQ